MRKPAQRGTAKAWVPLALAVVFGTGATAAGWVARSIGRAQGPNPLATLPPLLQAARRGDAATVRSLLDSGADVNAVLPSDSDLIYARGWCALTFALAERHPNTALLLVQRGTNPNGADARACTVLMRAAGEGDLAVTRTLIGRGADVDARDVDGWTPLMVASCNNHLGVARLLLARGADPNAREAFLRTTALSWALRGGHTEVVRLLLATHADLDVEADPSVGADGPGEGVLHWAETHRFREIARLLKRAGARR
jgi:ankyrin repeat protein